jgi:DNA repair exonuclease SbcCD ATPase subunit
LKDKYGKTETQIKRLDELCSYLDYVKTICKDDNIKQFAISAIMPYLNNQVNNYLSAIGSQFYVQFDSWLNENIEGPGIYKCGYGNLSGAESKSLDLALQFAFLDIARIQAGIYPDVLILDELLDTSVDSSGLNNILTLIKKKQEEDNLKVYLITHRKEVESSGIEFERSYTILKEEGFSYLKSIR